MSKVAVAKKVGMMSLFNKDGKAVAVTVLEPMYVEHLETVTTKSNNVHTVAVDASGFRVNKPQLMELKKINCNKKISFKTDKKDQSLNCDPFSFEEGDKVKVQSISKGKGFAGTVKRHNFNTGPKTHGSHNYRRPGSIGSMYPEHVFKGQKMAGRMGNSLVTVKNLKVFGVDKEANLLLLAGAVPGKNGTLVKVAGAY